MVELQKDGLLIPVKNFFGQIIVSGARAFQSTLKMQIFDHLSSNFNLRVRRIFKHAPHDLTYIKLEQTQS